VTNHRISIFSGKGTGRLLRAMPTPVLRVACRRLDGALLRDPSRRLRGLPRPTVERVLAALLSELLYRAGKEGRR
jgi:hypothetical protein